VNRQAVTGVELEPRDGVGIVWFDRPGEQPNLLDEAALEALAAVLERLENDAAIEAVVVASRKANGFIAGADITLFDQVDGPDAARELVARAQALIERLAHLRKPTVAAIHGGCAGGGLELALACDYRLASSDPRTSLALPEVRLGLLPALGGTQRLPRLIGLRLGLELLLTGKKAYWRNALRLGLVDSAVHREGLERAALQTARRLLAGQAQPPRLRSPLERLLESPPARELLFRRLEQVTLGRTRGNYPAPRRILDTVERTFGGPVSEGLKLEREVFAELLFTPQSRALRHLFFVDAATRRFPPPGNRLGEKVPGEQTSRGASGRGSALHDAGNEVKRLGVLGAGLMGAGIAQVSTEPGRYQVVLKDRSLELAAHGKAGVHDGLSIRIGKGLSHFERDMAVQRVALTDSYERYGGVDLTIEAVLEDLELKRRVLREVEAATGPGHIFASNTSSLPIEVLAQGSARPGNVVGMHYFSPVPKMPLLEVVRGPATSPKALATAVGVGLRQGKSVIVVADSPGFYVNRILAPYLNEALVVVREGTAIDEVDRAMEQQGFPVGPFRLLDNIGLELAVKVTEVLAPLFLRRDIRLEESGRELVAEGFGGRKSGRGFYIYLGDGKRRVNEQAYSLLRPLPAPAAPLPAAAELAERLLLMMVNEAHHCLHEGIIASPDDGDAGAVLGLGFPPFLGGPFHYTDSVGRRSIRDRLEELRSRCGERFRPAPGLEGG
jgi:3-hydroxyacyl-CoA dehydrogenase/enoyl-CoA hydratase/3-hydroxybutyryl-CoA epimerase